MFRKQLCFFNISYIQEIGKQTPKHIHLLDQKHIMVLNRYNRELPQTKLYFLLTHKAMQRPQTQGRI